MHLQSQWTNLCGILKLFADNMTNMKREIYLMQTTFDVCTSKILILLPGNKTPTIIINVSTIWWNKTKLKHICLTHFMTKRAPRVVGIFFLVFPFVYLQHTNNGSGVVREAMLNKSEIFVKTHDWKCQRPGTTFFFFVLCSYFILFFLFDAWNT